MSRGDVVPSPEPNRRTGAPTTNDASTSNCAGASIMRAMGRPTSASICARWSAVRGWEKLRRITRPSPLLSSVGAARSGNRRVSRPCRVSRPAWHCAGDAPDRASPDSLPGRRNDSVRRSCQQPCDTVPTRVSHPIHTNHSRPMCTGHVHPMCTRVTASLLHIPYPCQHHRKGEAGGDDAGHPIVGRRDHGATRLGSPSLNLETAEHLFQIPFHDANEFRDANIPTRIVEQASLMVG